MPAFRSAEDRSSEAGFVFRSRLPVGSRFAMLPFFPHAIRLKRSLDVAGVEGGVLHYELVADLRKKVFLVDSAWVDEPSFRAWVGSDEHVAAMRRLGPRVSGGTFDTEVIDRG